MLIYHSVLWIPSRNQEQSLSQPLKTYLLAAACDTATVSIGSTGKMSPFPKSVWVNPFSLLGP